MYSIISKGTRSILNYRTNHSGSTYPLPISAEDAQALILAAFKAPDTEPRAELHGVLADKMATGVRVRIVGDNSHFDLPWSAIAQGIEIKEPA